MSDANENTTPAWPAAKPTAEALVLGQLTGEVRVAPGVLSDRRHVSQRRNVSIKSLFYGGFRPRRREGRRNDDHHVFLDWHEPRVLYLALGVVLMNCADALFTLNILAAGGRELNGIMELAISGDTSRFLMLKIGLTSMSVVFLVMLANRRFMGRFRVMRLLQLFCAGYGVLMVYELYLLDKITSFGLRESLDGLRGLI
jgi:hypothetical protein